jgi:predicted ester cyclase
MPAISSTRKEQHQMARSSFTQLSASGERRHRWLVHLVIVIGLVGVHATAMAGPVQVPAEDDGGGGSLTLGGQHGQATIRLFAAVLSDKVPGVCSLLMAADAVSHTPAGDFTGPDEFERYVAEAWGAYPDATFSIDAQVSNRDQVTVRWTMTGRHLEAFGDLPVTGADIRLEGIAILRFEGGMIAESWLQYDRMALAEQVEAAQAEQAAADREARDICPPCFMP